MWHQQTQNTIVRADYNTDSPSEYENNLKRYICMHKVQAYLCENSYYEHNKHIQMLMDIKGKDFYLETRFDVVIFHQEEK